MISLLELDNNIIGREREREEDVLLFLCFAAKNIHQQTIFFFAI